MSLDRRYGQHSCIVFPCKDVYNKLMQKKWVEFYDIKCLTKKLWSRFFSCNFFFYGCKLKIESDEFVFVDEKGEVDPDDESDYWDECLKTRWYPHE